MIQTFKITKFKLKPIIIVAIAVMISAVSVTILLLRNNTQAIDSHVTVGVMSYNVLWDNWSQAEANDIASKITTNNIDFAGLQEMNPARGPVIANIMTTLGANYSQISTGCTTNPIIYKSSRWSITSVSGVAQWGAASLPITYSGYTDGNARCYMWGVFQDADGNRVLYLNFHLSYFTGIPDATLQQLRINQAHTIGNKVLAEWAKSASAAKNPLIMTCDCNTTTNANNWSNAITALQFTPNGELTPGGVTNMSRRVPIDDWTDWNAGTPITIDHIFYDYRPGNTVLSYSALPYNATYSDHRAIIASLSLNATEYVTPSLTVSSSSLSYAYGGGSQNVNITGTNVNWTATSNQTWATVSPGSGSNSGTISITAAANTGAARSATITVSGAGITRTITVNQAAAPSLSLSETGLSFVYGGGSQNVSVTSNVSWTASSNQTWASVSPTSGTDNGTISITAAPNSGSARTATITVTGGGITRTVSVSQDSAPTLNLSESEISFSHPGGSESVIVTSDVSWTVSSDEIWASVSPTSGTGNGTVLITVDSNSGPARNATITFSGSGVTKTIAINQSEYIPGGDIYDEADTNVSLAINAIIAISLDNCNASNSDTVNLHIGSVGAAGAFKSNCQILNIDTNAPGYQLTARANSSDGGNDLIYQNPTTTSPLPVIPASSNSISSPASLSNDTWGFAVTSTGPNGVTLPPPLTNFNSNYTDLENANNKFAKLPAGVETQIYSTNTLPGRNTFNFYYAAKVTLAKQAGTYITTVIYTATANEIPPLP